jgi:hypothetical protein
MPNHTLPQPIVVRRNKEKTTVTYCHTTQLAAEITCLFPLW